MSPWLGSRDSDAWVPGVALTMWSSRRLGVLSDNGELSSNFETEHHNTVGEHIDIRWRIGDLGRRSTVGEIGRVGVSSDDGGIEQQ